MTDVRTTTHFVHHLERDGERQTTIALIEHYEIVVPGGGVPHGRVHPRDHRPGPRLQRRRAATVDTAVTGTDRLARRIVRVRGCRDDPDGRRGVTVAQAKITA